MTTYAWPTSVLFRPANAVLRQHHNNRVHESPQSGDTQTNSTPGAKWGWVVDLNPHLTADRAPVEAFFSKLSGREHRVSIHDFKRPVPRGTCNLSGVTASAAVAFAETVTLNGCGNARTLLAGDWIKFATGQLVMVTDDATSTAGGVMTVTIRHQLRTALTAGSAVTLDKPTALYILTSSTLDMPRQSGLSEPPVSLEFIEVFS